MESVKDEIRSNGDSNKGFRIDVLAADLSTKEDCEEVITNATRIMSGMDVLILNHITSSPYDFWIHHNDTLERVFYVNAFSYIWMATAALETLQERAGRIVVVSSLAGHIGTPLVAAYSASKHALHGFFNALRVELAMKKSLMSITLCAIGATDTEGASAAKSRVKAVTWDPPIHAAEVIDSSLTYRTHAFFDYISNRVYGMVILWQAIVRGAALRKREIFHPHHIVFPSIMLYNIFPFVMDRILAFVNG